MRAGGRGPAQHLVLLGLFGVAMAVAACASGPPVAATTGPTVSLTSLSPTTAPSAAVTPTPSKPVTHVPSATARSRTTARPTPAATTPRALPAAPAGRPLSGRIVVLDPGHNGANYTDPSFINKLVWIVNGWKACDTTGTSTNSGYTEAAFTFDVAGRTAAILRSEGATVVLTRSSNTGVGPCINVRAAIGNAAHADAAVSIHADGGPAGGLGFQVILPGNVGPNAGIIAASDRLGSWLHAAFHAVTGEPYANYVGGGTGYTTVTDLGGLNLSTVPKVFVECANMRNSTDAARLTSSSWRALAAAGIAQGITDYLLGR